MTSRRRVGVRAMRQNLSVYLRRAGAGETFEVTTRGLPVAVLAPFETAATPLERLEASGRATPAGGDLLDLGPPPKLRQKPISRASARRSAGHRNLRHAPCARRLAARRCHLAPCLASHGRRPSSFTSHASRSAATGAVAIEWSAS